MQSDDKDSLGRLVDDMERALATGDRRHCACGYYGRCEDDVCDGCPAYGDDDPCTQSVLADVARRLHALMPHDMDGREIKVGDTVKNLHGQFEDIEVMEIRAVPFGGELTTARRLNAPATYPSNWVVVQPDSWERLEADATLLPHDYLTTKDASDKRYGIEAMTVMVADLVCRAKKLAGVE